MEPIEYMIPVALPSMVLQSNVALRGFQFSAEYVKETLQKELTTAHDEYSKYVVEFDKWESGVDIC